MKDSPTINGSVLIWPKRLLSADDLRRHLTSQGELVLLPKTIVTPLAADELRAKGVRVRWENAIAGGPSSAKIGGWIYAVDQADATIATAIQALEREGITLSKIEPADARAIAEAISLAKYPGAVLFGSDPGSVVCIANKVAGIRAVSVMNALQVKRAHKNLGANLFAIEIPGRTLFEIRHMLKAIVTGQTECPGGIAKLLKELDGHAHR